MVVPTDALPGDAVAAYAGGGRATVVVVVAVVAPPRTPPSSSSPVRYLSHVSSAGLEPGGRRGHPLGLAVAEGGVLHLLGAAVQRDL